MFDGSLPEVGDLRALGDAELVAAAGGWTRVESAAAARKLAVMAEVFRRRTGLDDATDRNNWFVDPEASAVSELAAAGEHHRKARDVPDPPRGHAARPSPQGRRLVRTWADQ
ncbi:hypothetical protein MDOR_06580 [Mycolicibacterium doricum]|uniref:Uncharacterized protein n=1 Tax=Mycolicibacterium doricum TaxID=126673 RepID=A0A7I7VMG0_9MYCO|nr:hypothetical protein [Mycolicibacterium doricum]BBZ06489.1 hypothetical protein MDOR_06580 [Mycolicibacterium doricum]